MILTTSSGVRIYSIRCGPDFPDLSGYIKGVRWQLQLAEHRVCVWQHVYITPCTESMTQIFEYKCRKYGSAHIFPESTESISLLVPGDTGEPETLNSGCALADRRDNLGAGLDAYWWEIALTDSRSKVYTVLQLSRGMLTDVGLMDAWIVWHLSLYLVVFVIMFELPLFNFKFKLLLIY